MRKRFSVINNIQSITSKTIKFVSVEGKVFVNDLGQRIMVHKKNEKFFWLYVANIRSLHRKSYIH
jgi:hypothetical protein